MNGQTMAKLGRMVVTWIGASLLLGMSFLSWAGDSGVISIGYQYACGLTNTGEIWCWGDAAKTPPSGTFVQIAAERVHACGLKTNGSIACWGNNSNGQSMPPLGTFSWVSTGADFSCAVKQADNRAVCWGNNADGKTAPPAEAFTQIALGTSHGCGITTADSITCWGSDERGQISETPRGKFTQLTADERSTCAVKSDQTVVCWGEMDTPSWLSSLTSVAQISYISSYYYYSGGRYDSNLCVLRIDGSAYCDANPVSGQFVLIAAGNDTYSRDNDYDYQCGLEKSGALTCTGDTAYNTIPAPADITFMQPSTQLPDITQPADGSCTDTGTSAHATFDPMTGELHIPFVDVPSILGGIQSYEVYLTRQPLTFTFDLDMNRIVEK